MSQTRADLDQKLTQLEERAREMSPGAVVRRHMPDYAVDRAIGLGLTIAGSVMAWRHYRAAHDRKAQLRAIYASQGCW